MSATDLPEVDWRALLAENQRLEATIEAKDAALKFKQEEIDDLAQQVRVLEEDRDGR